MKTQNYNSTLGSVLVGKVTIGSGITYFPRYSDDGELPKLMDNEERVTIFTGVNAIDYNSDIRRLCDEASSTLKRNPRISESKLVEELNELLKLK